MDNKAKKIQKAKDVILKNDKLSKEHKEKALSKVEEWYLQDKAEGLLGKELLKIAKEFDPILEELGLM
jgi:hypothetical protein